MIKKLEKKINDCNKELNQDHNDDDEKKIQQELNQLNQQLTELNQEVTSIDNELSSLNMSKLEIQSHLKASNDHFKQDKEILLNKKRHLDELKKANQSNNQPYAKYGIFIEKVMFLIHKNSNKFKHIPLLIGHNIEIKENCQQWINAITSIIKKNLSISILCDNINDKNMITLK